jgi:hypothetical protein
MYQTKEALTLREKLSEEHAESRKRMIRLKGKLESFCVALDLATVHVEISLQGLDVPETEQAFRNLPSFEELLSASTQYRRELRRSVELAAALAECHQ